MLNVILYTLLSMALGAIAGGFLALSMGGPTRAGKNPPLPKRLVPALISLLLLLFLLSSSPSLSSKTLLVGTVFLSSFGILLTGTTLGLGKRDGKLMEMASVFRVPALSRMRFIDLPACKGSLLLSLCLGAIVSFALVVLIHTIKGGIAL